VQAGREPKWESPYVTDAWDAMLDERRDTEEDVFLHAATATDLLVYVLEEAGGTDVGVGLTDCSGGRCESEYRLLYAEKPEEVCGLATNLLEQFLVEQKGAEQ